MLELTRSPFGWEEWQKYKVSVCVCLAPLDRPQICHPRTCLRPPWSPSSPSLLLRTLSKPPRKSRHLQVIATVHDLGSKSKLAQSTRSLFSFLRTDARIDSFRVPRALCNRYDASEVFSSSGSNSCSPATSYMGRKINRTAVAPSRHSSDALSFVSGKWQWLPLPQIQQHPVLNYIEGGKIWCLICPTYFCKVRQKFTVFGHFWSLPWGNCTTTLRTRQLDRGELLKGVETGERVQTSARWPEMSGKVLELLQPGHFKLKICANSTFVWCALPHKLSSWSSSKLLAYFKSYLMNYSSLKMNNTGRDWPSCRRPWRRLYPS